MSLDTSTEKNDSVCQVVVDHFSADRSGTDVYLFYKIKALFPEECVTATQDSHFDLLRFSRSGKQITVVQLETSDPFKRSVYIPAERRKDGPGRMGLEVIYAEYHVSWENKRFKVIVAKWTDMNRPPTTQWHIIGHNQDVANELILACASFCSAIDEAILIFDQSMWRPDHKLWQAVQKASWKDVILSDALKKSIQNEYKSFFDSEDVYKDYGVPWKRGLILLGTPGNGKTITLKAMMKDAAVPALYVKSFHTHQGDEFGIRQVFSRARAEAPCLLILEDLDSLITDGNRSFFLNEVDGLEDNDGLLLIGTTNHFDKLDPALSNRPSRFDRKYVFPAPAEPERRQYAKYWQQKVVGNPKIDFSDTLIDKVASETDGFSFAYLKEAFVSALLIVAGKDEDQMPDGFGKILLEQIAYLREHLGDAGGQGMADSWGASSISAATTAGNMRAGRAAMSSMAFGRPSMVFGPV